MKPQQAEYVEIALLNAFGDEWLSLSQSDKWLVAIDFNAAHEHEYLSATEYRDRIYVGNLEAYAKCLS